MEDLKQTIVGHLGELRRRLIWVAVVNLGLAITCFYFMDFFFDLLHSHAINVGMSLIYINPPELFMVYIKLSFVGAIVIASPFTLYNIWAFIRTGLKGSEKTLVIFVLTFGLFFFALGSVFCYIMVIPITLRFFLGMGTEGIDAMISVREFFSFVVTMLVAFGVVFEMPVIVALLARMGFLKEQTLRKNRAVIILLVFVFSAIITPPDVISQIMLGVPMMGLLQLSIYVCRFFEKKHIKAKKEAEEGHTEQQAEGFAKA